MKDLKRKRNSISRLLEEKKTLMKKRKEKKSKMSRMSMNEMIDNNTALIWL